MCCTRTEAADVLTFQAVLQHHYHITRVPFHPQPSDQSTHSPCLSFLPSSAECLWLSCFPASVLFRPQTKASSAACKMNERLNTVQHFNSPAAEKLQEKYLRAKAAVVAVMWWKGSDMMLDLPVHMQREPRSWSWESLSTCLFTVWLSGCRAPSLYVEHIFRTSRCSPLWGAGFREEGRRPPQWLL